MSLHFRKHGLGWLASACVLLAGCGGDGEDRPDIVPVSGAVMYNGNPVPQAEVKFMAKGAPRIASGVSNDKGEFQLSTFDINDGAVIGEHTITVSKYSGGDAPPATTADPRQMMSSPSAMADTYRQTMGDAREPPEGPKSELPEKYADPDTSGLKETVTADGPNRFVLQLKD